MAQSGYTPIILYNSPTTGNTPSSGNLALGELAINTTDGILFYKTTGGTVTPLANAAAIGGNFTNIVVSSTSQLGTVSSGIWHGTAIGVAYGGTNLTATPANGQLPIGNGTNYTLANITAGTGCSVVNTSGGIQISATGTGGGTVTSVNGSGGSTGLTLTGGPISTTGTLTIGGTLTYGAGGTGVSSAPANGQILIGNGSGYTLNTLSAGSNITITNTAGGISIASTGGSGAVTSVSGSSYIGVSPTTGAVVVTNTGVTTVNGSTGNISNVAITSGSQTFSGTNIYSGSNTFSSAVSFNSSSSLTSTGLAGFGASNPGSGISGGNSTYAYFKTTSSSYFPAVFDCQAGGGVAPAVFNTAYTSASLCGFFYGNITSYSSVGAISTNSGGTGVVYNTSSDRRLKTNIEPLTDSGTFIDMLLPRKFTWISNNEVDTGFIADELQNVIPNAVTGQAGAVDENGKDVYQQIDASTSEMIANIIAELQSLRARLKAANIA